MVSFGGQAGLHSVAAFFGVAEGGHERLGQACPTVSGVPEFFRFCGGVAGVRVVLQVALCGRGGVAGGFSVVGVCPLNGVWGPAVLISEWFFRTVRRR